MINSQGAMMKKLILMALLFSAGTSLAQPGFDEAKELWADRGNQASLEKAIAAYEKAYQTAPTYQLAERLAYAWYFLGDAFEQGEARSRAYLAGYEWGLKALSFDPGFRQRYQVEKKGMGDAIAGVPREFAGAIFWTATSYGKWGKMRNILKQLGPAKQARKMILYLYSLDKDYYYGGPAGWRGTYYAVAPGIAGGDLEKSKRYYEEALAAAPDYLATKVLMAENYAAKAKDRALYDRLLDEVLAAPDGLLPEAGIEQTVEKKKAARLKAEGF
jgi:tetratricopeptide (TPR) repeat protein